MKNETPTFPNKTVLSKANPKTKRMGSRGWTSPKEQSFATYHFSNASIGLGHDENEDGHFVHEEHCKTLEGVEVKSNIRQM